jgi:endonuclease/exonuclease/phosphatase family metal-dependent hydrolase
MQPLTVATYNVRHAGLDDGPDGWPERRAAVLDRLRALDPDVLALQECAGDQHADVAAGLPHLDWVGVAEEPGSGEHNPIGYGPRLELREGGTTWLSATGEPGSVGWDADYPRVLTTASLHDGAADRPVTVFNAHLSHVGPRARRESAALIRRRVADLDGRPALLVGDFNTEPGDPAYERFLEGPTLVDARTVAETATGPATTLTEYTALRPGRRVDHVLVTPGVAVRRHVVDDTTVDGRYPSDHLPVVVEATYPEPA